MAVRSARGELDPSLTDGSFDREKFERQLRIIRARLWPQLKHRLVNFD